MKNLTIAVVAAMTLTSVGCNKKDEDGKSRAEIKATSSQGSAATGPAAASAATGPAAASAAAGCDLVAFEKEQADSGREAGKAKSFSGCKFTSYNEQSRMALIDENGASDYLSCVNIDKPAVEAGDIVDIEGKIDGAADLQLYGCTIKKRP